MMRWFVILLVVASAAGSAAAGAPELSPKEMEAGRKLDVTKCAKCHKLYEPAGYSQAEWDLWMAKMTKKSKLKTQQAELLTRYFAARRGTNRAEAK